MDRQYPGPYCQGIHLTTEQLRTHAFEPVESLTNGVVLEVKDFADKSGVNFESLLIKLDSRFDNVNKNSLKTKLARVVDQKKKLSHKKKVAGVKNVKDLLCKQFDPPACKADSTFTCPVTENVDPPAEIDHVTVERKEPVSPCRPVFTSISIQTDSTPAGNKEYLKDLNSLKYEQTKLIKHNDILSKKVLAQKEELEKLDSRKGHFSVRNVNKRDERARKNLHDLRDAERTFRKQEKTIKENLLSLKENEFKVQTLESENTELKEKLAAVADSVALEKAKKLASQKSNSYLRKELQAWKNLLEQQSQTNADHEDCEELIEKLHKTIEEQRSEIDHLEEAHQENDLENFAMKNEDGSYTENVRLCVIELAGLEVATEKTSPVIQTVVKHLLGREISKNDLPNPSTCQRIIDEGHYIAKVFIAEKLESVENWGLGRDGTTRRKQKIIDTAVTLEYGDVISLGFKRVARETAETINNVTKSHLEELGTVKEGKENQQGFVANALSKLSFTMSDRASNEKLADKLLDEWREKLLTESDIDHDVVNHFHCMAHVLLGFHSYTISDIRVLEADLVSSNGPIGRDTLPVFSCWSKKETIIGRTVRVASDSFGPAGDHLGVRDRWEAFCSENGVKSLIGNYRDNRFNALFKTAAEIYLHLTDFVSVIDTVSKPNLKLKALKSDSKSDEVRALLQCLGLFYVKFTGPYWNMITCGKVQYMQMSSEILEMKEFLESCEESPPHLLREDCHWADTDPHDISAVPHHTRLKNALFTVEEETRDLLFRTIPLVARAMIKVIEKQLVDFLLEGKFHQVTDKTALEQTKFAQVTNLGCEHHFGDLDSSQRRRPRASFHHHTSIQLLKRNRTQMMEWIGDLNTEEKSSLLATARKAGPELRRDHLQDERSVLKEIHSFMTTESEKKDSRKRKSVIRCGGEKRRRHEEEMNLPHDTDFVANEYVAVAYQDSWYPGVVEKTLENQCAIVKFMTPCRNEGHFQWPRRDDKQTVNIKFVIHRNFIPDCVNSGRQWLVNEYQKIDEVYMKFYQTYFE